MTRKNFSYVVAWLEDWGGLALRFLGGVVLFLIFVMIALAKRLKESNGLPGLGWVKRLRPRALKIQSTEYRRRAAHQLSKLFAE